MKFAQFKKSSADETIFINPEMVELVRPVVGAESIFPTAIELQSSRVYYVTESVLEVIALLQTQDQ